MVRSRVHIGSAESRYRAFQLAHADRQKYLFPLLLAALLAVWALSVMFVGPIGAKYSAGYGANGPGNIHHASQLNCFDPSNAAKIDARFIWRKGEKPKHI